jgi:hypothetical protein
VAPSTRAANRSAALADELGQISTWLAGFGPGEDKASIMIECAWKDAAAAAWTLERPVRTRPEGWLGNGQQRPPGG